MMDPYLILEVNPRASDAVIKAAFHALMKTHHPDVASPDKLSLDKAVLLNNAYAILSDPKKRKEFDKTKGLKPVVRIGNYAVLEEIAEGGFGVTYKGQQELNQELVCIKHCSEVSAAHDAVLIQESKAIWDLRHYALPAMRDILRLEDGSLALVMSYVPGPTLEQVVEKAGKLDAETTAWITDRILNALLYLHQHGVIHGDIKPQNVLIQAERHSVVLVDFGLSQTKPTSSTKAMGYTPVFAPPEQISGKPLLPASDFYSLGMLMIYALTGGDMKAVKAMNVPATLPDPLFKFLKSLVQKDILSRPMNHLELFDQFREVRKESFGRNRSGMKAIPGL